MKDRSAPSDGYMKLINQIPLSLTLLRAVLGPVVLALAVGYPNKFLFGVCLVAAFLSDVFDGIIARRLNIATPTLRRLDSVADSIFYVCAAVAAWLLYPDVIKQHLTALAVLVCLELVRYVFDYAKFKREAAYHMWSSKLWGIFLFLGFLSLLGFGNGGVLVSLAIYVGIIADLEGIAISMIIREWKNDIPSVVHAMEVRANQRA